MTIETARRLTTRLQRLRMKTFVVIGVRRGVKERTGQIGKLFAGCVTPLALQIRAWRWGRRRGWAADNGSFVGFDWS